ncbi:hypothetical protein D7V82_09065 [bacterium 1xD8-6]|nr:hypothetical protein D7V72_10310 [bacterium D16-36]RKI69575.1 hypothetical protein D7V82_09065 [bacterium 1xD8-6]
MVLLEVKLMAAETNYEIRLANRDDIPMIMEYIDQDWRRGHIMSVDRGLFEYELLNSDGTVNMVIAVNHDNNRIDGCLGFLKSARKSDVFDTWGTIWKVREDSGNLLGLKIINQVKKISGGRFYLGIGINPNTAVKIHKMLLRDNVAKMKHYYCLAERSQYKIAVVKHKDLYEDAHIDCDNFEVELLDLDSFIEAFDDLKKYEDDIPYKNKEYFIYRYFQHPIYSYQIYGIYEKGVLTAFFVLREDSYLDRIAIRMIDYHGKEENMRAVRSIFPQLFADESVEYIDFYEYGFLDQNIEQAGFNLLDDNDSNIIPNYFAPFVQENIDIWIASPIDGARFVKGDGDQDRPNEVKRA